MANTILDAYISNYDNQGEWVDMTLPVEDIQEIVDRLTNNGMRDYRISDYRSDYISVGLDTDFLSVNDMIDLANEVERLANAYSDAAAVSAIVEAADAYKSGNESIADFISSHEFYLYDNCASMADVAYNILEESGRIDELPDWSQGYFDYTKFGRDLEIEGQFYFAGNDLYVEIDG